ncbi:AzlD family protein [Aureimonas sp. AU4]|uniref:AzlD family protein n=1 Tax=Aureimonas sp. AU4 TaxID=1638163 RepID=UPI0009EBC381|nr:AzlD domain-containing protein [Aureimonas sp. AU4]
MTTYPIWTLILVSAALTYATRVGGYLILRSMGRVPPRLDAALNAVPPAVLIALVVPAVVEGGIGERLILFLCLFLSLRLSLLSTVTVGVLLVIAARAAGIP